MIRYIWSGSYGVDQFPGSDMQSFARVSLKAVQRANAAHRQEQRSYSQGHSSEEKTFDGYRVECCRMYKRMMLMHSLKIRA
jgi:hypothetical protein